MIIKPLYQLNASGFSGSIIDTERPTNEVWSVQNTVVNEPLITFGTLYSRVLESIKTNPIRINAIHIITSIAQLMSLLIRVKSHKITGNGSEKAIQIDIDSKTKTGSVWLIPAYGIEIDAENWLEFDMNPCEQIIFNIHYTQLKSKLLNQ